MLFVFCWILNIETLLVNTSITWKNPQKRQENQIAKQFTFQQFLSINSNRFLLFYLYLHRLIYCTKHSSCFFSFPEMRFGGHCISFVKSKFSIYNFLRHQILNYCIQRKPTRIIEKYILKFPQKIILKCYYYNIERVLIIFVLV